MRGLPIACTLSHSYVRTASNFASTQLSNAHARELPSKCNGASLPLAVVNTAAADGRPCHLATMGEERTFAPSSCWGNRMVASCDVASPAYPIGLLAGLYFLHQCTSSPRVPLVAQVVGLPAGSVVPLRCLCAALLLRFLSVNMCAAFTLNAHGLCRSCDRPAHSECGTPTRVIEEYTLILRHALISTLEAGGAGRCRVLRCTCCLTTDKQNKTKTKRRMRRVV